MPPAHIIALRYNRSVIEFRQLRYFVAIVDAGSLTRASKLLPIAQPALSQQMADLEATVGSQLLHRSVKGVTPTEAGQAVYRHAQAMLQMRDQTQSVARGADERVSGRVRLGLPSSVALKLAAPLVKLVGERYPDILLELYESTSTYLAAQLLDEHVALGLLVGKAPVPGLESRPLLQENVCLVQAKGLPAPGRRTSVGLADLAGVPLILTTRATTLRQVVDAACVDANIELEVKAEASSIQTLLTVVAESALSTLVPQSAFSLQPAARALQFRPVLPVISRPVTLAWSRSRPMSQATECVRKAIFDVTADLLESGVWQSANLPAD